MTRIAAERRAFADTVEAVGPAAPTLAVPWTAEDVAAHVVSLDRFAGIPTFIGRSIVARRAIRLNDVAGRFAAGGIRAMRRRGFDRVIAQLRDEPPPLLVRPSVAAVGLFEVLVHHEDVRRANQLGPRSVAVDGLDDVIGWLLRYHRSRLPGVTLRAVADGIDCSIGHGAEVTVTGDAVELVVWLAGRRDTAEVALTGDDDAVARLRDTPLRV